MKHRSRLKGLVALFLVLVIGSGVLAIRSTQAQEPTPQDSAIIRGTALGSAFTYQGRLADSSTGDPIAGPCDFQFSLWDAAGGGTQIGSTQTASNVTLSDGSFSATLDFGADAFEGEARYLQIGVRCPAGSGGYTTLNGRVALTGAPYAHSLRPGATIEGSSIYAILSARNASTGEGVRGETVDGWGIAGVVDWMSGGTGVGVYGQGGFYGLGGEFQNVTSDIPTVRITNSNYSAGGPALEVYGGTVITASEGYAALEVINQKSTVAAYGLVGRATSTSGVGVMGTAPSVGVYGAGDGYGVQGVTDAVAASGVFGQNVHDSSGYGVYGDGFRGVQGWSNSHNGAGGFFVNVATTDSVDSVGVWAGSYYGDIIQGHELDSNGNSIQRRFRVTYDGYVYADNGYNTPAADFAEMLPAVADLEPGDVLAIGPDGRLVRSSEAYQPTVMGVYSTDPGFLGGAGDGEDLAGQVPLAVVGVVPVKASAENGPIQPGDMLVASSIPGHAMLADLNPPVGTVIGKALGPLESGTGVILMLVILQ